MIGGAGASLRGLMAGALGCTLAFGAGCHRVPSPEQTCEQLLRGIAEGDAITVFEVLTQPTQWALYTVQRNHQKMRQLIESSYPATERPAALARLYGADDGDGRGLFSRLYAERYGAALTARLGAGEPRQNREGEGAAPCARCESAGPPFRLQRAAAGRWGFAELDLEWDQAQLRAVHDLATVQKNADLYRQAGGSPAPRP